MFHSKIDMGVKRKESLQVRSRGGGEEDSKT